jgi:hypothetical protein
MKIEFIEPKVITKGIPRIRLLKDGKLSFNTPAAEKFGIKKESYYRVGVDTDNPNKNILYLLKSEKNDVKAKRVFVSGTKTLLTISFALQHFNLDYKHKSFEVEAEKVQIDASEYIKITINEDNI